MSQNHTFDVTLSQQNPTYLVCCNGELVAEFANFKQATEYISACERDKVAGLFTVKFLEKEIFSHYSLAFVLRFSKDGICETLDILGNFDEAVEFSLAEIERMHHGQSTMEVFEQFRGGKLEIVSPQVDAPLNVGFTIPS